MSCNVLLGFLSAESRKRAGENLKGFIRVHISFFLTLIPFTKKASTKDKKQLKCFNFYSSHMRSHAALLSEDKQKCSFLESRVLCIKGRKRFIIYEREGEKVSILQTKSAVCDTIL